MAEMTDELMALLDDEAVLVKATQGRMFLLTSENQSDIDPDALDAAKTELRLLVKLAEARQENRSLGAELAQVRDDLYVCENDRRDAPIIQTNHRLAQDNVRLKAKVMELRAATQATEAATDD